LILVGSEPPIGGLPPSWLSYFLGLDAMSCRCVKDQEGTGELQYLWNTGATAAVISESPTQPTTYTVNITNGSESCTESIMISVSNIPEPIVIFNGSNLYTTETGIGYQWYLNGIAISGETSATLEPTQNGTYVVEVTNATGCIGASDPYVHLSTTVIDLKEFRTRFYPNPSTGQFTLEINNVGTVTLQVTDLSGRIVYSKQLRSSSKISHHMVDLSGLAKGTYSLQVRSKGGDETQVVVIE